LPLLPLLLLCVCTTQRLCKAMLVHRTVQSLDLPDNSLGDVGVAAIADLLDAGAKITSLQLSDNEIGDEGMIRLAKVKRQARCLFTMGSVQSTEPL
jgi:Ran GTPase-activating protein (RanGAP) involved in mRNA processing and transport